MISRLFSLFLSLSFLLIVSKASAQIDFSFLVYDPDKVYAAGSSVIESTSKPGEIYTAKIEVPKGQNGPPNSTYWSSSSEYTTQLTQENSSSLSTVPNSDVVNTSEIANLDTPEDSNESTSVPVFAVGATASVSFQENNTSSVYTASATGANSYSISGGDDASLFTINAATGELSFKATPDYENPLDNGTNNTYSVTLKATNNIGDAELGLSVIINDDESDNTSPVRLVNISTRGYVGTGESNMIVSFIIEGEGSKTVTIRALGPVLTTFGVSGALSNPYLTVTNQQTNEEIVSNDDWQSSASAGLVTNSGKSTGIDPLESAVQLILNSGQYSAVVSGVNGATGNALVEVYDED